MTPGTLALACASAAFLATPHPDSLSRTRFEVRDELVRVEVSFQALSLLEAVAGLDADDDLELSQTEVQAGEASVGAYLVEGLRLGVGDQLLAGELGRLDFLPEALAGPRFLRWMRAELVYRAPAPVDSFWIEHRLFREKNPWHTDVATVAWNDDAEVQLLFTTQTQRLEFEPAHVRKPRVRAAFLQRGIAYTLRTPEALLLLLLLLAITPERRGFLATGGLFLAAESLAFVLGAAGVVELPARFVALAGALSVAYLGVEALIAPNADEPRRPWAEAAGFGLLHGALLFTVVARAAELETLFTSATAGFALGASLVQLALFVALLAASASLARRNNARRAAAIVGIAGGLGFFLERAGWLPLELVS